MKIALIKQKTGYNTPCDREQYKNKILNILKETNADIVVGPELAISNSSNIINNIELDIFNQDIIKNLNYNQLIIPGTGLIAYRHDNTLRNVAPILTKEGSLFFNKKSSDNEEEVAKNYNLVYKTGEDPEGIFTHKNKIITVEICRDHGHGKLRLTTRIKADLEFILACNLAGVSPEKTIVKEGGIIGVSDGNLSEAYAYKKRNDQFDLLKGKETKGYLLIEND